MLNILTVLEIIQRRFLWVNVILITLLSFISAKFFSGFMARALSRVPLEAPMITRKAPEDNRKQKVSPANYDIITQRNIFCSLPQEPSETGIDQQIEKTPLNVRLIGTIMGPPDRSLALIEDRNKQSTDFYRIGDTILGQAKVLAIERNRVIISRGGTQEFLMVYESDFSLPTSSPPSSVIQSSEDTKTPSLEVRQVAEGSFEIDRLSFEEATRDFGKMMTEARVVPHFIDGKISGYKIFAIKPGSLYTEIGMQNGDIITRINGIEIDSPEKALQLLAQLKTETQFQIDFIRNGQPRTNSYRLR